MKSKHTNTLIIALTIHVFSVQSKLLFHLNPDGDDKDTFSFFEFNESTILAMLFALSYSLATFFVVNNTKNRNLIYIYAGLDAIGVLLYYYTQIPDHYRAVYFALYTGILILSTIYLDKNDYLADHILELKQKGVSQKEIALQLDISESMVSRILKRINESNQLKTEQSA